ncbi:MAG: DUF1849 family protein [Rhodospirillales bacterium]|nr:DUF1849 family protein [Rhodospirillales bacterium]
MARRSTEATRRAVLAVLAAGLLAFAPLIPARAAASVRLAAHQAFYRLTLADGRNSLVSAAGTMGYEVVDACRAWHMRQRLDLRMTSPSGEARHLVSDYQIEEAKDGTWLRFQMVQTINGAVDSEIAGAAKLDRPDGPGEVTYTAPRPDTIALPAGTLFPMAHTAAVIGAAETGKVFHRLILFDGSSTHGAALSTMVTLARLPPEQVRWPALAALPSVRVHLAFFGHDPRQIAPEYETAMRYWTNGVAGALTMDFGDFAMAGHIAALKMLPDRCPTPPAH